MTIMKRFQGKTAIVTGGASGIGEAIILGLAAEGANVVISDIDAERGDALAERIGGQALFQRHDATSEESWADVLAATDKAFGAVNILVNNVGGLEAAPLESWTREQFQRSLDLNLFSTFHGVTAVTPVMKQTGGGSIVNVASMAAMRGYPAIIGYVSAKWAVRGLTKAAALELGAYNIRVNAVHPGQTRTPATEKAPFKSDHVALKRIGLPDDVARVALFLASDDSRWVTGADYMADGGELAGDATYAGYPED